jgi:Zn-dependent protease
MREISPWSLPLGRYFGIAVRVHPLFWIFSLAMLLRAASPRSGPSYLAEAAIVQGILFLSVLLHEFGHCFGARAVDGDASEILMWPLGGLAFVDVPNTPRAHFVTAVSGPAVNLLLCALAAGALSVFGILPPFNPLWDVIWHQEGLYSFAESKQITELAVLPVLLARLFSLNWMLFLFNMLLPAFPLDSGRIVQCALWTRLGFQQATRIVLRVSVIVAVVMILAAVFFIEPENPLQMITLFSIAVFIIVMCKQQEFLMETGALGDEGIFGYDFSQGYTSLERGEPAPRRAKKKNFLQRWLQQKAEKKRLREEQQRQEEERRVDELLAKVQQGGGMHALTEEEKRFLIRVSARLRNRDQ